MKKKILAITLAITTVFSGIAWPGEVLAEESKEEVQTEMENLGETDVEKLKPSENLGTFSGIMSSVKDAIYLPDGLKKIGWSAFLNGGMEFIYVSSSVIEIDNYAFSGVASIRCEEGSYAEEYARANNVSYEIVSKTEKDETEENETKENETTFPIENCIVTLESKSLYYDGFAKEPMVTVTNGEIILKQGVDYVVSYENNVKIGTATVNITGIGTYTGFNRTYFDIVHRFYAKDVVLPTGTPEAEVTTYVEGTEIPNQIVLYVLDEKWYPYLTMPQNFQESFQLHLEDGMVEVVSGESVAVDAKGFITPSDTYGESVLRLKKGNNTYDIQVKVVDYAKCYAQNIMQLYVKESVLSAESDLEKLERICAFVGAYDYSSDYSGYTGMIVAGGGDCVASSSAIMYMCELVGLPAKLRYAANDSGVGNGHRNVAVQIEEEIYIADAGLDAKAPRTYFIEKTEKGWSYYQTGMDSIKLIQYDGFKEHVTVPSDVNEKTVTTIGEGALYYGVGYSGAKIKSITIPDTITEIGDYAFERSGTLEAIHVDAENEYFASEDGVLFDKKKERLIAYPTSKKGAYIVPSTVKTIGAGSFADVTVLESIQISGSVNLIETRAFDDCWSLKKIQFLGDAPVIEDYAFNWVKATAFYPADNTTWTEEKQANFNGTITWKAWREGDSLDVPEDDETGNDKTEIGTDGAGTGNHIENTESENDTGLSEKENNVGQNETGNGSKNSGTEELTQIGTYLQIGAFEYRIIEENEVEVTALISSDKKAVIQKTVSYMGTTYKITGIADKAFKNEKITQLTIGNNIKTIGKSAFEGCKKLTQVTIGNKVTKIGKNTFKNCKKLKKITIKSSKIKNIGSNAFKGIKTTAKIKVPKKKQASYKKLLKKAGIGKKAQIIR